MARSVWKGPFVHPSLLKKIDKIKSGEPKRPIKTWSRNSTVIPDFVGHSFLIGLALPLARGRNLFITTDLPTYASFI